MKRSEINHLISNAESFIRSFSFALPPFSGWTSADWAKKGHECDEIRDNMLGWDVTDYGLGQFSRVGLVLFTLRNGNQNNPRYQKTYAEKLLISREEQVCPMHFHWNKMEDIINRGGGNLMIQVYNAAPDESLDLTRPVEINSDGEKYNVPAGSVLRLEPGQSISIQCGMYHQFWGEKGTGKKKIQTAGTITHFGRSISYGC